MPSSKFTLLSKKEGAHSDFIYCCIWTAIKIENASAKDFIITGGLDCLIKIWTLRYDQLELMHTLKGHLMAVISLAISPDGHTLASSSLEGTLIIWDVVTGTKVHAIKTCSKDVWSVIFSPDGTQVATGGHTERINVFSAVNGDVQRIYNTLGHIITSLDWSKDNKYICAGSLQGFVCIYDVNLKQFFCPVHKFKDPIQGIAISSNSQKLAAVCNGGKFMVYDITKGRMMKCEEEGGKASAVCFGRGGRARDERVAFAFADGSVCVMLAAVDSLATQHTFREHEDVVWGISFNPSGDKLVSVSADKSINIYQCPLPEIKTK